MEFDVYSLRRQACFSARLLRGPFSCFFSGFYLIFKKIQEVFCLRLDCKQKKYYFCSPFSEAPGVGKPITN